MNKQQLMEQLRRSIGLMFFNMFVTVLTWLTQTLGPYCPRMLSWRRTSVKELEEVDREILNALPCVEEQRFVHIDADHALWSIVCNRQGQGTPLVMVHGMGSGVGLWALNLEALSRQRPVYAFDLLGFGRSSRPEFPEEAAEVEKMFVDSIEKYRIAMGLEQFILLGHSLGAFLSAAYALRYPQHVRHLVLVDPWGITPQHNTRMKQLPLYAQTLQLIMSMDLYPLSFLRASGPLASFTISYYHPYLARRFADKLKGVRRDIFHRYLRHCNLQDPSGEIGFKNMSTSVAWARHPIMPRLPALDPDVAVTFVYGAKSWISRHTAQQLQTVLRGYVDVQIVRGAGHHLYADRADLFNTLVETIADSVDRGALPSFNMRLVQRIHACPTLPNLGIPNPSDLDLQRPLCHWDENVEEEEEGAEDGGGDVPTFSLPHDS